MSLTSAAETPRHRVLVIGCGSIGERHVRTFLATGRTDVAACDNRSVILDRMRADYCVEAVTDWQEALRAPRPTAVVFATPAPLHIAMARRAVGAGRHVLIEKPLDVALGRLRGVAVGA